MAVRRRDRARLARLAMPLVAAERASIRHRQKLRSRLAFFRMVRGLMLREGVDPEGTHLMRELRLAEAELAAIPDTPELRRSDRAYLARADTGWIDAEWNRSRRYRPPTVEEKTFDSEVDRLVCRYRENPQIAFDKASAVEVLAWCLSRQPPAPAEPGSASPPLQPAREFCC